MRQNTFGGLLGFGASGESSGGRASEHEKQRRQSSQPALQMQLRQESRTTKREDFLDAGIMRQQMQQPTSRQREKTFLSQGSCGNKRNNQPANQKTPPNCGRGQGPRPRCGKHGNVVAVVTGEDKDIVGVTG